MPELPKTATPESVTRVIHGLVQEETFEYVLTGGPFGREGQLLLTRRSPGFDFWGPGFDFGKIVETRQLLWDDCIPWTDGLSRLFDSTQEELDFQHSLLGEDAKRVESAFVKLSPFEKIAREQLVDMRRGTTISRNFGESDWLKVLDALDKRGVAIDAELADTPKKVLEAVRSKGHQITSWKECYQFKGGLLMDDGRTHTLRREVTHAIHNAAKRAAYKLSKVWSAEGS